ncbi:cardiolipin synthase [Geobacter argillaceus]|uniref:Cardiolipin synthase n=1 Tax=Geobacter argillaceus TaxID=345631 RepID=A0A562VJN4_9BACT|nr:cardiolipin synthase [Geobacter argillaceus]TWJ18078.1 cardiolipin synthetase 2 [Geobacter argillaceus]
MDHILTGLFLVAVTGLSIFSAGHALLSKRDPRSALGWIVTCMTIPLIGPFLYWCMGVNWIRRTAQQWQESGRFLAEANALPHRTDNPREAFPHRYPWLAELCTLADQVVSSRLCPGSGLTPLINGEQAYPAMLEAIEQAQDSIHLCTYIFDGDETGRRFCGAMANAAGRGVTVRVLIDGLGEKYSRPRARKLLKGSLVQLERFLPLRQGGYVNLRNHRKVLVVDGKIGFSGGMNISDRHLADRSHRVSPVRDVHFRVEGPVVADLQRVFLEDWFFVTGDNITAQQYFPALPQSGDALVRAIGDGPDKEFRKLHWIIMGALSCARQRIVIMTPYFIPDRSLVTAIITAALRGVEVTLILPGKNNLPPVHWASRSYLWEFLQHGIRVWYQPPPFVHTKLFLVDGVYGLVGSANLDPRSLRLNFELNLEVFDRGVVEELEKYCTEALAASREVSLAEMDGRPLPERVRDSLAKLFSPYL